MIDKPAVKRLERYPEGGRTSKHRLGCDIAEDYSSGNFSNLELSKISTTNPIQSPPKIRYQPVHQDSGLFRVTEAVAPEKDDEQQPFFRGKSIKHLEQADDGSSSNLSMESEFRELLEQRKAQPAGPPKFEAVLRTSVSESALWQIIRLQSKALEGGPSEANASTLQAKQLAQAKKISLR